MKVTEVTENYRNWEVRQSVLVLEKAPAVIENHLDFGKKFWTYLTKIKQLRGEISYRELLLREIFQRILLNYYNVV